MSIGYVLIYGFLAALGVLVAASVTYRRVRRQDYYAVATDLLLGLAGLTVLLFIGIAVLDLQQP